MKSGFLIIAILLVAAWWRLYRLEITQPSLAPDELDYLMEAKAVAYSGRDLSQTMSIWSLQPFVFNMLAMGELAPLFQLPTMAFLPITLVTAKIMPVIYSLSLIIALGLLVYLLTRKKELSLWTMLVVAINPWAIFIGRTGYDGPVALALFTWSFVCLAAYYQAHFARQRLCAAVGWFILFTWAFFTYHGLKIPGCLLTVALSFYMIDQLKISACGGGAFLAKICLVANCFARYSFNYFGGK